jgi:hypothetical protein
VYVACIFPISLLTFKLKCVWQKGLEMGHKGEIQGSHNHAAEDECLLVCDILSLGDLLLTFKKSSSASSILSFLGLLGHEDKAWMKWECKG